MRFRRFWLIFPIVIVLSAGGGLLVESLGVRGSAPPGYQPAGAFDRNRSIAILGNAFRPTLLERLFMFRQDNTRVQAQLMEMLKRDSPGALIFLGDFVGRGASAADWRRFDDMVQYFYAAKTPILPVLGGREYAGLDSVALAYAHSRFPSLQSETWYSLTFANLGMVILNSNRSQLDAEAWDRQADWFKKTLAQMDGQPAIDAIVVFMHHPPISQGKRTSDSESVSDVLLPIFLNSKKSLLLIAGHTGSLEKFYEKEKYFFVTGGAGGTLDSLGSESQGDLIRSPHPRPFHYLLLQSVQGGVTVEAKGFEAGEPNIRQIDKSFIPFR